MTKLPSHPKRLRKTAKHRVINNSESLYKNVKQTKHFKYQTYFNLFSFYAVPALTLKLQLTETS